MMQAVWAGMFYFGLNDEGFISSHVFDRKISKKTPQPLEARLYPWITAAPSWEPELIAAAPVGCFSQEKSFIPLINKDNIPSL